MASSWIKDLYHTTCHEVQEHIDESIYNFVMDNYVPNEIVGGVPLGYTQQVQKYKID